MCLLKMIMKATLLRKKCVFKQKHTAWMFRCCYAYRICSAIRRGFLFPIITANNYISPMKLRCNTSLPFLDNPKDLYPVYKTGLDFGMVLEGKNSVL